MNASPEDERRKFIARSDVVMRVTDAATDQSDELPLGLAPTDPVTDEARRRMRAVESRAAGTELGSSAELSESRRPGWQFQLRHLLLANLVLAVVLAFVRIVAPQMIAFILGVVAFAALIGVVQWQPTNKHLYTAAWGLILLYLVIASLALVLSGA